MTEMSQRKKTQSATNGNFNDWLNRVVKWLVEWCG